jgi:ABC-type phosphate transport system permease subunit
MRKYKEFLIEKLILLCGLASIFFVVLIFLFLLKEGFAVFKFVPALKLPYIRAA